MKAPVCGVCGFIAIDGTTPGACPVCGAPSSAFSPVEDAILSPVEAAAPTDAEKKHTPEIHAVDQCSLIPGECRDVHVRVGTGILHPMEEEHYIGRLDFYLDGAFLARVHLTSKVNPGGGLHLKADTAGRLAVVSWCNKHGAWMNTVEL